MNPIEGASNLTEGHPPPGHDSARHLSRLQKLFDQALELPSGQRDAWIDERLANEPEQARLLRRMLAHDDADMTGISRAVGELARDSAAPRDRSGEQIDRYRLVSRIRYGGMAEVYRAERDDGQFDHEVALKVIRSDRVRPELNELFFAERALMARLNHPNITQIFDGGTTSQGEAYFVMELLDGTPLPAAIGQHGIGSSETFRHLSDLCAALNHVHSRLIVHRDIKPENVLLCRTPRGLTVKLLDFGIAARLDSGFSSPRLVDADTAADAWHSPGYAAPEARAGQTVSAAADIYSLGRLILDCVGHVQAGYREETRAIGEHAAHEDPQQRYAGAIAVAEDLDRMRRREPISLFRRRRLHVLKRALQRHHWAAAATVALVLAGTAWLWRESALRLDAEQATATAQVERNRAEAMRDFLLNTFRRSNPSLNQGDEPRLSELLIEQLDQLEIAEELDPESRAQLFHTFGDLLLDLDRRELAERSITRASDLLEEAGRSGEPAWISSLTQRGIIASRDGRFEQAAELFMRAEQAIGHQPASTERARLLTRLYSAASANAHRRGHLEEAERLIRLGLAAAAVLEAAGDPADNSAALNVTLGALLTARGDLEGALSTFQRTYERHLEAGQSGTFEHLALLGWLGVTHDRLGQPDAGEPYLIGAVALAEQLFPQPNSRLSGSYANLGSLYLSQGRLNEAEPLLERALEVSAATGDESTPTHGIRHYQLGMLAFEAERTDLAIDHWQRAHSLFEGILGSDHRRTRNIRFLLTLARIEAGREQPSLAEADALVEIFAGDSMRVAALLLAARLAAEQGLVEEAEDRLDLALEAYAISQASPPEIARRYWLEGRVRDALSQPAAARDAYLAAARAYQRAGRESHPARGRALLHAALLTPHGDAERTSLGHQAREILGQRLQPPASSLRLLDTI